MGMLERCIFPAGLMTLLLLAGCAGPGRGGARLTGSVTLLPGALTYRAVDTIQVAIANQSAEAISFSDHQTNCTVLQLERRVANSWEMVEACKRMIATRLHTLQAGQRLDVALLAPGQWPGGVYRARLDYLVGAQGSRATVVSREFRIG